MRRLISLLVLAAAFVDATLGQDTVVKPPDTRKDTSIRQVDLNNFRFVRCSCRNNPAITLVNGKEVGENGTQYYLMRFTYGELDDGGSEDAAILIRKSGTTISDEIFILGLDHGSVAVVDHFSAGGPGGYVFSIPVLGSNFVIKDGVLVVDEAILRQGEHAPTHYFTIRYRLSERRIIEDSRSRLKVIPDGWWEIG